MATQPHLWNSDDENGNEQCIEVLPYDGSAMLRPAFLDNPDQLLHDLLHTISWEDHYITLFGKSVREPRQSAWFHRDGVPYRYSQSLRESQQMLPLLDDLMSCCEAASGAPLNSVLANLYRDGSDSMGWHADDEPELGREPVIASLSLGAERRFDFRHREMKETVSIVLPHGSLLVMSGQSQHKWMHRIARTTKVSEPRVNLTFRLTLPH